jgi:putative addiction module CopG family antidote
MNAHLAPEESQFLMMAVASGKYRDESEALTEAVRLLKQRDELRALLEVGERELDAGLGMPAKEVFDRLERRAAELDNGADNA